jgi:tetratricopeptide (TPR) repeat protein
MAAKRLLSVVLVCCLVSCATADKSSESRLVAAKASLMAADYRGDLATLAALRTQISPLMDDPSLGYLASYWSGFASWRIAINGSSANMSKADLKANLARAAADFETSIRKKDDFADAYAAASSVHGWLVGLNRDDPAAMRPHIESAIRLLKRAVELDPYNPRVLWVQGGNYLFNPHEWGGNHERAIETYHKQVDSSAPLTPQSPLPDWGKAEALMSLAYAHLNQTSPDLAAATEEAQAALHLQPEWHYVRDILVPQIEASRKQAGSTKQCSPPSQ